MLGLKKCHCAPAGATFLSLARHFHSCRAESQPKPLHLSEQYSEGLKYDSYHQSKANEPCRLEHSLPAPPRDTNKGQGR